MEDKELLTVREFAEAAGVTNKAIYQQIQGRLNDYVVIIDDTKYIKREALEKFYSKEDSRGQVKSSQESSQVDSRLEPKVSEEIKMLNRMLDILNQQLEDKQTIIEQQSKTIDSLNSRIESDGIRLDNMQKLLNQQQNIMLTDRKDDIKEIIAATKEDETVIKAAAAPVNADLEPVEAEKPKKKKFLGIFPIN